MRYLKSLYYMFYKFEEKKRFDNIYFTSQNKQIILIFYQVFKNYLIYMRNNISLKKE